MRTLVIGYGNSLRGDDAAGPYVVRRLDETVKQPGVTTLACQQLTPELAHPISQADLLFFVDALAESPDGKLTLRPLGNDNPVERWATHRAEPAALLHMADTLYAHRPRAFLIGIPAAHFHLDAPLSRRALGACEAAVRIICRFIQNQDAPRREAAHA